MQLKYISTVASYPCLFLPFGCLVFGEIQDAVRPSCIALVWDLLGYGKRVLPMVQLNPLCLLSLVRESFGERWLRPETLSKYLLYSTSNCLQHIAARGKSLGCGQGHENLQWRGAEGLWRRRRYKAPCLVLGLERSEVLLIQACSEMFQQGVDSFKTAILKTKSVVVFIVLKRKGA